jgi:hypothetical protein
VRRRERLALALLLIGLLLLVAGTPFSWIGLAALLVGLVWYATARRRRSLPTFAVLLGVLSLLLVASIWFFFAAIPSSALGLGLAAASRPSRARYAAVALNGLAFAVSVPLALWVWLG